MKAMDEGIFEVIMDTAKEVGDAESYQHGF